MRLLPFMLILSHAVGAQVTGTQVGVRLGSAGGSYYDVPSSHPLDKYGPERLSPKGLAFIGTLASDDLGHVYFRKISVARSEDQTKLGTQTLFLYDSPHFNFKEKNISIFLLMASSCITIKEITSCISKSMETIRLVLKKPSTRRACTSESNSDLCGALCGCLPGWLKADWRIQSVGFYSNVPCPVGATQLSDSPDREQHDSNSAG